MKIFWIICLVMLLMIILLLGFYLLTGFFAYKLCLTRKGKIKRNIEKKFEVHLNSLDIDSEYFNNGFEKLSILSEDNLKLYGFYKSNLNNKLIILVHGYGGNHKEMANYAKFFEKRGYDILAIDQRCHGESEGIDLTMGKKESEDLLLWINRLLEINSQYKIVLFGLSMGATTVCIACGENLPTNVVLAIEDCGYDNANKQFLNVYLKSKFHNKFFYKIFYNYTKKTKGLDLAQVDANKSLKSCRIPVMFIHGSEDKFVPTEMVYSLSSQISPQRSSLYIAEGASHAESYSTNPQKYEKEIDKYLSQYLM